MAFVLTDERPGANGSGTGSKGTFKPEPDS